MIGRRGVMLSGLFAAVVVCTWLLLAPSWATSSDANGEAGADSAADATLSAAGLERSEEDAALSAEAPEAALARHEAIANDDGRARVDAADVLVLDADGRPLAGAAVEATADGAQDRRTTDAAGRAIVRLPLAPAISLRARAPGHLPTGRVEHPFGEPATIAMVRAARLLARVQDESGRPIALVRVGVRGRVRVTGVTDAEGCVVLDEIRSGTYDVALNCDASTGLVRASLVGGLFLAPGDNAQTFVLAKGTTVGGVVVDAATRAPIAAAAVRLRWESRGGGVYGIDHERTANTGADGRFSFPGVAPGRVRVTADTRLHAAQTEERTIESSHGDLALEFGLQRTAVVRGRVVDAAHQPVGEAEVTLGFGANGLHFLNSVTADAQGQFELLVAPRDGLLLVATKPGRGPGAVGLGKVSAGEVREGVEIEMKRGFAVRGRVRSAGGPPLSGAEVTLVPKLGADRFARVVMTATDGTFRFDEVAAFPYRVEARASAHVPAGIDVTVSSERAETDAGELSLLRAYSLEGVVVARGAGVGQGGARVMAREASGKGASGGAMTDELGRFTISDLPEGDYLIDVRGPDVVQQVPQRVRLPQRGLLRVAVEAMVPAGTGIVELKVIDPGTRQPLPGVEFPGIDVRRIAYADGVYGLRGIPAGRLDLRLRARGYQPLTLPGVLVLSGQVRDLHEIALQPAASLRVRVVDERGKPFRAGQVRIELVDTQGLTAAPALAPAQSSPERGVWSWDGLALSRFELRVRGPDTHAPSVRAVDAFAPQLQDLRLQLARKPKPAAKPPAKPKPPAKAPGGGK